MAADLSPLSKEIGKKDEFKLTEEIKNGMDLVKNRIKKGISANHLQYPDINSGRYVFIACDTSLKKTGSVIGNVSKKDGKLVDFSISGFGSKALKEQETYLSSRGRELVGVSYALKNFSEMLPRDRTFLIIVDHKSLKDIHNSPSMKTSGATRVRGAFADMLEWPLAEVLFLPNTEEIINVVDAISRISEVEFGNVNKKIFIPSNFKSAGLVVNQMQVFSQHRPVINAETVKEAQRNSQEFSDMIEDLKKGRSRQGFMLKTEVLYKITSRGAALAVVPSEIGRDVINFMHVNLGHLRVKPLLNRLKTEPIWLEGRNKIVQETVRSCLLCAMTLAPLQSARSKDVVPIRPPVAAYQKIFMDLFEIRDGGRQLFYMTCLDGFSLRLVARRIKSKSKEHIVPEMMIVLTEFAGQGRTTIVHDNGKEFISQCAQRTFDMMDIAGGRISPYNSSGNRVENAHRCLRQILKQSEGLKVKNFDWAMSMAVAIYNNRPKAGLDGLTPNEVALNLERPIVFKEFREEKVDKE